ncbi:GNAT family N-acetyltransferase [Evansella tamaricis]|uniref:GNAT family N-acetyltransferase n=1 Tax=Evansella tamaricis TaxID=2069301 RepID=A0ABS6JEV7_9BACI|nr:GNAT family N-acetyltransferase [Evansella tamaricis]MBU9712176.1 GNAT family N-acetyltransferase [Evansella tamaricis]
MQMGKHFYQVVAAKLIDAKEIADLIIACDIEQFGVPDFSLDDLLEIWNDIPMETNTWVIRNEEDKITGYGFLEEVSEGRLDSYGYVHPSDKGKGIGTILLNMMEKRIATYATTYEKKGKSFVWNNIIPALNADARHLLESREFVFQRLHSKMEVVLTKEPDPPCKTGQSIICPYEEQRDGVSVWRAYLETFQDTREFRPISYDEWMEEKNGSDYDKQFWYVAYSGKDLVGYVISKIIPDGLFIDLLGVKKAARNKGLGLALLQTLFLKSYEMNIKRISLMVDANSITGANRLYEKAGMQSQFQLAVYCKKRE